MEEVKQNKKETQANGDDGKQENTYIKQNNQHVRTRELNRKHCVQFTILNSYIDIDQLYFLL